MSGKVGLGKNEYEAVRAEILARIAPGEEMQTLDIFAALRWELGTDDNEVRSALIYMVRAGDLTITDHWTYARPKKAGARIYQAPTKSKEDTLMDWLAGEYDPYPDDQDDPGEPGDQTWWGF